MGSAIAKDLAGHILSEDDRVVFSQQEPQNRGRIDNIARIFDRGPYEGGTRVTIVHEVTILVPPGHAVCPVTLAVKTQDEIKQDERRKNGLKPESPLISV